MKGPTVEGKSSFLFKKKNYPCIGIQRVGSALAVGD